MLRYIVVDVMDLTMQRKQSHWSLCDPTFPSLHLQLDQMVESFRSETGR